MFNYIPLSSVSLYIFRYFFTPIADSFRFNIVYKSDLLPILLGSIQFTRANLNRFSHVVRTHYFLFPKSVYAHQQNENCHFPLGFFCIFPLHLSFLTLLHKIIMERMWHFDLWYYAPKVQLTLRAALQFFFRYDFHARVLEKLCKVAPF